MRPWEIARLTDYQIDHLYRLPALRQAHEVEKRMKKDDPTVESSFDDTKANAAPPSRDALVSLLMQWGGRSQDQAEREAEDRLANWHPDGS